MIYKIAIFITLMMALLPTYAEITKNLNVTASPWTPFVSRDLPENGLAVSIAMTALQKAGYEPTFALEQWPKDLEETRLGRYDVIASLWFTEERAKELVFSQPMIENRVKLMVRSDSEILIPDLKELKGYRVGVVEDYAYTQGAYSDLKVDFVKTSSVEESLQRLLAGEIDIAVVDETVAVYVLNSKIPGGIKQIRFIENPVSTRGLRIAVSRQRTDAEQIVSDFNAALQRMKDDGSYLDILHQFRVSP